MFIANKISLGRRRFGAGGGGGATPLLDSYTGAHAVLALVKMYSSYSGAAIKIREAGTDTETDISFTGIELNEAAIASHCGANNGYIVRIYDQSGNGFDWVQSTTSLQPLIYNGSSVVSYLGEFAWDMGLVATATQLTATLTGLANSDFTMIQIAGVADPALGTTFTGDNSNMYFTVFDQGSTSTSLLGAGAGSITTRRSNGSALGALPTRGDIYTEFATESLFVEIGAFGASDWGTINANYVANDNLRYRKATILYLSDKSADIAGIETALNSHYAVY